MSARAIASTTISFGLVSLPVKLYSTGELTRRVSFNLVHRACGTRLKQHYVCPQCDVGVTRDEMVKGYEFAKGQYVLFKDEELKAIEVPKTDSIEITEFVPAEQVSPVYVDKPYYLGPDKGGARAYRLLSAALGETGRVAIAKYATRGKQSLVVVRPHGEGLVLDQLRYADEVRSFEEVPIDEAEVKPAEMTLARQLIQQSSVEAFEPQRYTDEVREKMLAMIQQKAHGREITVAPAEEPKTQIIDLIAALKASLASEEARKPASRAVKKSAGEKTAVRRVARKSAARKKKVAGE